MTELVGADPRGVIFDLDGTLYPMGPTLKLRMTARLWRWGELGLLRYLAGARDSVRGREFEDADALDAAVFCELGRRAGTSPKHASRWYNHRFLPSMVAMLTACRSGRASLNPLLARMRERGLALAVLSDYEAVDERLDALRIPTAIFDLRCASKEAGALKPSPRPFVMVAERMGLDPEQILVVGDRDDTDRAGATAAKMRYLGVEGPRSSSAHDWPKLRAILDTIHPESRTGSPTP